MKKVLFPILILIAAVLVEGCSSGKKAYEQGNYDAAVLKAIYRLRKSPNNKKASQTLRESYPLAINWHRDNVNQAKLSNDEFKWETVVREYEQVNHIYNELSRCPACRRIVPNAVNYISELNDAKNQAAAIRYQRGEELLASARSSHDRYRAREAYLHFETAYNLLGDYKDTRDKMAEAKFLATLKVVVEPMPQHSRSLQLSNEFFENKILEFLETMPVNEFVRFYSYIEAKNIGLTEPDQIIQLHFDDFVVGQVYLKEKEVQLSKDSVVLAIIKASNKNYLDQALVLNTKLDGANVQKYQSYSPYVASPVLPADHYYFSGKNKKVTVCHKIPGSLGATNTLVISENALQHHLDHGDQQGPCEGESDPQTKDTQQASGQQPNPDQGSTASSGNSSGSHEQSNEANETSGNVSGSASSGNQGGSNSTGSSSTGTHTGSGSGNTATTGTPSGQSNSGTPVTSGSGVQGSTVTTQDTQPSTRKVYGTVKATVHVFHKSVTSHGVMDFKIIDAHTQRVLTQEKMPGEFVWYTEWGYFNGDERALDEYFLEVVKLKEAYPPSPQDLFVAFTQPIYGQITHKIRDFYRNY